MLPRSQNPQANHRNQYTASNINPLPNSFQIICIFFFLILINIILVTGELSTRQMDQLHYNANHDINDHEYLTMINIVKQYLNKSTNN